MVLSIVIGIPAAMIGDGTTARLVNAVLSSVLNAAMAVYLVAIVGAVHHQLAGGSIEQERRTFE